MAFMSDHSATEEGQQVVQMVTQGLTNGVIAERPYLSRRTVESHLCRVYPELGVSSRAASQHAGQQARDARLIS